MTDVTPPPTAPASNDATRTTPRGPLTCVLDFFSSIWLGVVLLTILFVYSSVGSALIFVRESRFFEMTEFEWFHWWPFNFLCFLICLNIVVATLRRIPLTTLRLGVWMIHAGIIILAIGAVYYFGTKFEGDTPIMRRQLLILVPDEQPTSIPVLPGNHARVGGYTFRVHDVDPAWELQSGGDAGERAYSVSILVDTPDGDRFIRQLIADYPQYTEDILFTDDPQQPMVRAINETGEPLVNESVRLALDHEPQDEMYLMNSAALYVREVGEREWIERPIRTGPLKFHEHMQRLVAPMTDAIDPPIEPMPRYQDYIADLDDVWLHDPGSLRPRPLDIRIPPASDDDPLGGIDLRMTSYTRYADFQTRRIPGGEALDPSAVVRLRSDDGRSVRHQLVAFDPEEYQSENGTVALRWIEDDDEIDELGEMIPPRLTLRTEDDAGEPVEVEFDITETLEDNPDLEMTAIEGTDYAFRVETYAENITVGQGAHNVSFASLEVQRGDMRYRRWVFDDEQFNRDMPIDERDGMSPDQTLPTDSGLETAYRRGVEPSPLTIIGGPEQDDLRAMLTVGEEQRVFEVNVSEPVPIAPSISFVVEMYTAHSREERKPRILPQTERDRDFATQLSMIQVELPEDLTPADGRRRHWLGYNHYPFVDENHNLVRYPYRPTTVTLADGREMELMFSRQRQALPHTILLDSFEVISRIGGFTGESASIRDWESVVRFVNDDGSVTDQFFVSTNDPISYQNHWYFQSAWDPPIEPRPDQPGGVQSRGLNYTVLGVGNRNGVYIQLFGATVAVLGMIYTFYVKPIIKRRQQQALQAELAGGTAPDSSESGASDTSPSPGPDGPGEQQARTASSPSEPGDQQEST